MQSKPARLGEFQGSGHAYLTLTNGRKEYCGIFRPSDPTALMLLPDQDGVVYHGIVYTNATEEIRSLPVNVSSSCDGEISFVARA